MVHLGEELHGGLSEGKARRPKVGQQPAHGVELVQELPHGLDDRAVGLLVPAGHQDDQHFHEHGLDETLGAGRGRADACHGDGRKITLSPGAVDAFVALCVAVTGIAEKNGVVWEGTGEQDIHGKPFEVRCTVQWTWNAGASGEKSEQAYEKDFGRGCLK